MVGTNISDISQSGLGTNEGDKAPANAPLYAISYKHRHRATCQELPPSWPGLDYYEANNNKGWKGYFPGWIITIILPILLRLRQSDIP